MILGSWLDVDRTTPGDRSIARRQYSTPMTPPGRRFLRPIILLLSSLALTAGSGCGSAPVVTPLAARPVVATGPLGAPIAAGFQVDLRVHNPSSEDVPLERFDYTFQVDEVGRFEGRWAALRTLPPGHTVTMTVPASMTLPEDVADREVLDGEFRWRIDGGVRYQAPGLLGQILFDAGIRRPSEPFEGSGTFRLVPPAQTAESSENPAPGPRGDSTGPADPPAGPASSSPPSG